MLSLFRCVYTYIYIRNARVLDLFAQGKGKYSSFGFSTVRGHLIAGEERFSVEWRAEDSTVWLDLYSVSRGSGVLGKVNPQSAAGSQFVRHIGCTYRGDISGKEIKNAFHASPSFRNDGEVVMAVHGKCRRIVVLKIYPQV